MCRRVQFAFWALLLLAPARLWAGGPPWLCLPLQGVTEDSAQQHARQLEVALGDKVWSPGDQRGAVRLVDDRGQWYAVFRFEEDVRLSEVEAALQDGDCRVARDQIHWFGHLILEITLAPAAQEKLLADLNAVPYLSIEKSERDDNVLSVTLDLPYPVAEDELRHGSVGWKKFSRNDFSVEQSRRSEPPASADMLPSYKNLNRIVMEHGGKLQDVRWSVKYACRPVGGVTAPTEKLTSAE